MKDYSLATVTQHLQAQLTPPEAVRGVVDAMMRLYPGARKAAVLLALFEDEQVGMGEETCIAFIRRADSLRAHRGEIAFPGGGREISDATPMETALREAREEIGLMTERVSVLGILEPIFTVVSNFLVVPVVAVLDGGLGATRLQESEVAELIVLPLRALADPSVAHTEQWVRGGQEHTVYFYDYGGYRIWGATARMFNGLLSLLDPAQRTP